MCVCGEEGGGDHVHVCKEGGRGRPYVCVCGRGETMCMCVEGEGGRVWGEEKEGGEGVRE